MSDLKLLRVLLMEDDPGMARLAVKKLERAGHSVEVATNGEEGLARSQANTYDVLAVDQHMPLLSGIEVIRHLAAKGPLPPVIMVTGTGDEQTAVEAMKLGARDYIIKDVDGGYLELLPAVVQQAFEQHLLAEREKRFEQALKETVERYRSVFENTGTATVILGNDLTVTMANMEFEKLSGYSKNEIENKMDWADFMGGEELERIHACHAERMENSCKAPTEYEFRFVDKYGNTKDIFIKIGMIPGTRETIASLLDITPLRQAEKMFRDLFMNAKIGLYIVQDGKFQMANPEFVKLTGYSQEELMGMDSLSLVPPKRREAVRRNILAMLKGKRALPFEFKATSKDGREMWIMGTTTSIEYQGKHAILGNFIEITEKRRLEEDLLRSQKIESLGVLAGGIAHDFNNLLMVIIGNISLAQTCLSDQEKASELLGRARKASMEAKELTQRFIVFSRGGTPMRSVGSISRLLDDSVTLALSGSSVGCEFSIPDGLWPVEFDAGQIREVIRSLVSNAVEAMPGSGLIKVSAENLTISEENQIAGFDIEEGRYVKFVIQDEGVGIHPENLPRIFDPYFSTKEKGAQKGMGLGMATAYSIISNHEGYIRVKSSVGFGTTVTIYLPVADIEFSMQDVRPGPKEELDEIPPAGKARVLVMDDEELVREVTAQTLTLMGYDYELSRHGHEAIDLYKKAKESGKPFDLVILDLTVKGGMGGMGAIKRLIEIDRDVRAIVSSGYSNDPVLASYQEYGFCGAIAKPYEIDELRRTLSQAIGRENG